VDIHQDNDGDAGPFVADVNLPIEGKKKLIKDPPMTIKELMTQTKPFWPDWDKRKKLNCINTVRASEFVAKRLGIKDGTGYFLLVCS
jgi:hypothetical protein